MTTTTTTTAIANLSKLSKGRGEFVNQDKKIEVIFDKQDRFKHNFHSYLTQKTINNSTTKKELSIPKTYSTKKGPLLLFSEEKKPKNNETNDIFDNSSIKTVSDLQRNVLIYGLDKEKLITEDSDDESLNEGDDDDDDDTGDDYQMLSIVNLSKQKLARNDSIPQISTGDIILKKINRGFSARRYLSNWTKTWDQKLLDSLIKDGKINQENLYEPKDALSRNKKRINDDLSAIPPAYRIHRHWLFTPGNLKGYRFFKVQDYYMTKNVFSDSQIVSDKKLALNKAKEMTKITITDNEQIKIRDQSGNDIDYNAMDLKEKENVLSELLFQSALQNIAEQQMDILEDALRFNNPANTEIDMDLGTYAKNKTFVNDLTAQLKVYLPEKRKRDIQMLTDRSKSNKIIEERDEDSSDEPDYESGIDRVNNSSIYSSNKPKSYMFGKISGARWVNKKLKGSIDGKEKDDDDAHSQVSVTTGKQVKVLPRPEASFLTNQNYEENKYKPKGLSKSRTTLTKTSQSTANADERDWISISNKGEIDFTTSGAKILAPELPIPEIKERRAHNSVSSTHVDNQKVKNEPLDNDDFIKSYGTFDSAFQRITPNETRFQNIESQLVFLNHQDSNLSKINSRSLPQKVETKTDKKQEIKKQKLKEEKNAETTPKIFDNFKPLQVKNDIKPKLSVKIQRRPSQNDQENKKNTSILSDKISYDFTKTQGITSNDTSRSQTVQKAKKDLKRSLTTLSQRNKMIASKEQENKGESEKNAVDNYNLMLKVDKANKDQNQELKQSNENIQKEIKLNDFITHKENQLIEQEIKERSIKESTIKASHSEVSTTKTPREKIILKENKNEIDTQKAMLPAFKASPNLKRENSKLSLKENYLQTANKVDVLVDFKKQRFEEPTSDEDEEEVEVETQYTQHFDNLTSDIEKREPSFVRRGKLRENSYTEENRKKEPNPSVMTTQNLTSWKDWSLGKSKTLTDSNKNVKLKRSKSEFITNTSKFKINKDTSTSQRKILNAPTSLSEPLNTQVSGEYRLKGFEANDLEEIKGSLRKPFREEKRFKRNINWTAGDFDPRECFVLWSYETPVPLVIDKEFADALRRYAHYLARAVLGREGGLSLSDDIRKALKDNFEKLKKAIMDGKICREALEEYKKILKQTLARALKRKNLENVEIDDETLMAIFEHPPYAFEIYFDPELGIERIRVKSSYLRELEKTTRTIVTQRELDINDFDVFVDPITGKKTFKLKKDVAKKLGIPEGAEDLFEVYIDENGNQQIKLKNGAKSIKIGDTIYEVVTDPITGKQTLKMTIQQKVGQETYEDIMRAAENMTAEERHKYFQNLLKQSGGQMSDELRQKIIEEMLLNANNLAPEQRDNLLKDLMKNLITDLPPELAQKVLADIMKGTDLLDTNLKEQMIKNMLSGMDDLPDSYKETALKELMKNLDNLSSEAKNSLLQNILEKVEGMDGGGELSKQLRNEVLKEIIKNSQNLDEETRAKILQDMISKLQNDGDPSASNAILQELVKQMNDLPPEMRQSIFEAIKKGVDSGNISADTLKEIIKNADNIPIDLLESMLKATDNMQPGVLKELVKNLDKLPDELKQKVFNDMINNLDSLDPTVKQELLKTLLTNPALIDDPELREKIFKEIMSTLTIDDILKEAQNMTAEERNKYFQDLLKRAGDMSDEVRARLIQEILKNAENLDEETRNNLLRDLVQNVIKDLPPDIASKVLGEIMKTTENLDSETKQRMLKNLLANMDDLPPELKQQTLAEVIKNLDDLTAEQKQGLLQDILSKVDSLPPELQQETLKTLMNNMDNLSSEQKNVLLQNILNKVEEMGLGGEFSKALRDEVLKEIVKNSQDLDEETRGAILQNVLKKLQEEGGPVPDIILKELVKQMGDLPDSVKQTIMDEIKKGIENGTMGDSVIEELFKNSANVPKEILQEVIKNAKNLAPTVLNQIMKNLNDLPDDLKQNFLNEMVNNLNNLDSSIQQQILQNLNELTEDQKQKVINSMLGNLSNLDAKIQQELLKNLDKLSDEQKKQVMNEMLNNLQNLDSKVQQEILQNLNKLSDEDKKRVIDSMLNNLDNLDAKVQQDLLNTLLNNGDLFENQEQRDAAIKNIMKNIAAMPEDVRANILKDIAKNIDKLSDEMKKEVIKDLMKNIENLSEKDKVNILKNVAKNLNNLSDELKKEVLKDILTNIQNSSEQDRRDVLKQLLKNMNREELEEMISKMDISEEEKARLLGELRALPDNLSWDSDDDERLRGLSSAEKLRRKKQILEERARGKKQLQPESKSRTENIPQGDTSTQDAPKWQDNLRKANKEKDLMNKKKQFLRERSKASDGKPQLSNEQREFLKDFQNMSEEEKKKFLESLSPEERLAFNELQMQFMHEQEAQKQFEREEEMINALEEAKRIAAERMREKIALRRRMMLGNSLAMEKYGLDHSEHLTRAFVFSYYDLLSWLNAEQPNVNEILA